MPPRYLTRRRARLLLAASVPLLVGAGCLFLRADVMRLPERLCFNGPEGGWGSASLYALVFAGLGAVGVPPMLLIVPAVWGWPVRIALAIASTGGMGAALLGFLGSRHWARAWVDPRIPPRVRAWESRLERHALGTVIMLRLLFYLFPPITWLLGVSRIRLGTFVAGTAIGAAPGTLAFVLTGHGALTLLCGLPPVMLGVVTAIAGLFLAAWLAAVLRGPAPEERDHD